MVVHMSLGATLASASFGLNAVGLTGIVVWHLIPERHASTRLLVQIAFFLAMTSLVLWHGILPHRFEGDDGSQPTPLPLVTAKLLWWMHLAWALIGFVRIYLVIEGHPREARLVQDLVVGGVYVGVAASMLAFVFGVPIGTLVATSGVIAIILGLALQNTLGDVFSGVALTIGRPYGIGDWIVLGDGTEGRVVESNWRSTHLLTYVGNIVVLPNSVLAKLALTNVSRPTEAHILTMGMRIAPTRMPSVIVEVLRTALASCNGIVRDPPPAVAVRELDATALKVELQFTVRSPAHRTPARNEVIDRVYRHCKSAGLLLALPPTAGILATELPTEEKASTPSVTPLNLIDAIPLFSRLTPVERRTLADACSTREFAKGDVIAGRGDVLMSLMMVRAGTIALRRDSETLGFLSPGDCFGEMGLFAGSGEPHRLEAATRVTVYVIRQEVFAELLADRPALAEDLAHELAGRDLETSADNPSGVRHEGGGQSLMRTIQTFLRRG